jgi:dipeptidase E
MNSLLKLPKNLKGCFVGSGSEGLQQQEVCETIINLTKKIASQVTVLYIGTATYDLDGPKVNQTIRFSEAGCNVVQILCNSPLNEMENNCNIADVIVISGGNTLYAVDKWNSMSLTPLLRDAMERGAVLTGNII